MPEHVVEYVGMCWFEVCICFFKELSQRVELYEKEASSGAVLGAAGKTREKCLVFWAVCELLI